MQVVAGWRCAGHGKLCPHPMGVFAPFPAPSPVQAPQEGYSLFMLLGNDKLPTVAGIGHVNFYMCQVWPAVVQCQLGAAGPWPWGVACWPGCWAATVCGELVMCRVHACGAWGHSRRGFDGKVRGLRHGCVWALRAGKRAAQAHHLN